MGHIDEVLLARIVSESLHLPISAQQLGNSESVALRLHGLDRPNGFSVKVDAGLMLMFAELTWDTFSQRLIQSALSASDASWRRAHSLRSALAKMNIAVTIDVDGSRLGEHVPIRNVNAKSLNIRAQGVAWRGDVAKDAAEISTAVLAVAVALLPIDDELGAENVVYDSRVEGEARLSETKTYERSRSNRAVAILLHGTRCKVCELDFGERYDGIGGGYVEVHHLLPVHLMPGPDTVDPAIDLIPLCANCHRMAHRVDPPNSPEALRASLRPSPEH